MKRTILVPLDGSDTAEQTLWQILPLVERLHLKVTTLRCVPAHPEPGEAASDTSATAREYLVRVAARLERAGLSVEARVRLGDAASEILDEAATTEPYLVALTTHGRGGVARWVRGSVAQRLLRRCRAPLLLCKPIQAPDGQAPIFPRMLVPFDGSERSAKILPLVEDFARAYDSRVQLLRVTRRLDHSTDPEPITIEALAHSLLPARARLQSAHVDVEAVGRFGDAAAEIVACAEEGRIDLVALTTHGRQGVARWLFGSVAEHVLNACPSALLVQRSTELVGPGPD